MFAIAAFGEGRMFWRALFYDLVSGFLESGASLTRRNRRLRVRPNVAYAIAREAVEMGDRPRELASIAKQSVSGPTLCFHIDNVGRESITVAEVGLIGWFDSPCLTMEDPYLVDSKCWPRTLGPGESVVVYLTSAIQRHPVLMSETRLGFARSSEGETWIGGGPAIPFFLAAMSRPAVRRRLREA
ncbi:MAG: hypothetical protein EXQ91_08265 [Alphaproteobacteria bacterium]|nr:hypothetical protein [Alphaproteobacteria bacterium]